MDKDQVKNKIAELKAERKENARLNNESVVAYRARAKKNKEISDEIHELEASIRTERKTVKIENISAERAKEIIAQLTAKIAAEESKTEEVPD